MKKVLLFGNKEINRREMKTGRRLTGYVYPICPHSWHCTRSVYSSPVAPVLTASVRMRRRNGSEDSFQLSVHVVVRDTEYYWFVYNMADYHPSSLAHSRHYTVAFIHRARLSNIGYRTGCHGHIAAGRTADVGTVAVVADAVVAAAGIAERGQHSCCTCCCLRSRQLDCHRHLGTESACRLRCWRNPRWAVIVSDAAKPGQC